MNFPNLITICRILLVPVIIWLLISEEYVWALVVFLVAGISDAIDGFLARHFASQTELGTYLDPIADKLLLVSVFASLGIIKILPAWLVLLVTTRDLLIVVGVLLAWVMDQPFTMKPRPISKMNTAVQIAFVGSVLAIYAAKVSPSPVVPLGTIVVAALTFISGAYYMRDWFLHTKPTGETK